jgi:hypothetical protein
LFRVKVFLDCYVKWTNESSWYDEFCGECPEEGLCNDFNDLAYCEAEIFSFDENLAVFAP